MTDDDRASGPGGRIRRLLVALDASAGCLETLDELAALAARLDIDMQGLFVEDTDWLDLAGHRVVTAVPTGTPGTLDTGTIERTVRRHVAAARRAVEAAARRRHARVTFEVRRGRAALEVMRSAADDDVIVISRQAGGFTMTQASAGLRTRHVAEELIRETRRPVFILNQARSLSGPLYAAFDDTPSSERALGIAVTIASRSEHPALKVFLLGSDQADVTRLRASAQRAVSSRVIDASYETVTSDGVKSVYAAISARGPDGVLVLGADPDALTAGGAHELLSGTGCSVLLVR